MIAAGRKAQQTGMVGLVLLFVFALSHCYAPGSWLPRGIAGLLSPDSAQAQTPCITHIYEVLSVAEDDDPGNDRCPSGNCTPDVWVRTFEDGVEVSFENAGIVEPYEMEYCCFGPECHQGDPFTCQFDENRP